MAEPVLFLEDVSVSQRNNLVLSGVNLVVQPGEFYYLIGKTGSGKSSLLKTLYADLPLEKGKAQVVGFDLSNIKDKDIPFLRRKLGIVFQDFKLLNDRSVDDNLRFVLKATGWSDAVKIKRQIAYVLEQVGLESKGFKMPFELSGGEQQRLAIARALLNNPELILADEPTGNLDPRTSIEVMEVLENIHASGTSVLMATHDYSLILKFEHKTLKCEGGKLFEVVRKKTTS